MAEQNDYAVVHVRVHSFILEFLMIPRKSKSKSLAGCWLWSAQNKTSDMNK